MNRRNFFRTMIGGVAATAAVRTWPFRVFSFPSEIKPAYFVPEFPPGTLGALDRTKYPGRLCTPLSKNAEYPGRLIPFPESWKAREFYSGIQYIMWDEKADVWVLNPGQKSTLRTTT